ncbi:MAG: PD40 domain-containing protein [Bacteroidetes bacterium]|nr:PD40 domain-containing protein [Bacteroidota bacterium]
MDIYSLKLVFGRSVTESAPIGAVQGSRKKFTFYKSLRGLITVPVIVFVHSVSSAQDKEQNFRELFTEAAYHVEYKNYSYALPVYFIMDSLQPDNANIHYRIGMCYLNLATDRTKSIPWLRKAVRNTTRDWDDLSYMEKRAPMDAYFLLGKAFHLNYQFDTAIAWINKFKDLYPKKHILQEEADFYIQMCNTAKELMRDSLQVTIENMGEAVNSPFPDYCPVMTADESVLIFTSRRDNTTGGTTELDGRYMEDVYISISNEGSWTYSSSIGTSINTIDHDAAIGLSHDGQLLFLYRDDDGDGNIYQSELMGDIWTVPEKLSMNINSPSWETHASLSADGQVIYFTSDRKNGFGGRDIYRCKKLPDGEWSLPLNLGPVINTKYDEDGPFIQADGITLYFSSKGHRTMGGFDIFYSEINPEDQWSNPVNIGYPINTVDDDIYLVLSADGKRAYFSSIRGGSYGDKDIYKTTLAFKEQAHLTVLKGVMSVTDADGNPLDARVVVVDNGSGMEYSYIPNSKTGKYLVILPSGRDYSIKYEINGEEVRSENLFIPEGSEYKEMEGTYDLKPVTATGKVKDTTQQVTTPVTPVVPDVKLPDKPDVIKPETTATVLAAFPELYQQFFGYNVKEIQNSSMEYISFINNLINFISMHGEVSLVIEGSASKVPTTTFKTNQQLARIRSESAKDVLIASLKEKGADEKKIKIKILPKVQGPEYKGDPVEGKGNYEKYQYVKIGAGK